MTYCSVILVQCRPDKEKLMRTLKSIVLQKNVCVQLIIADDGSEVDFFAETEAFLKKYRIDNYCFSKNEQNRGTVINIWNALEYASGKYISLISPGDYYYNSYALAEALAAMERGHYRFLFGRLSPYYWDKKGLHLVDLQYPYYITPYINYMKTGNIGKIEKYLVLYHDTMVGASLFWEKMLFTEYLSRIVGKVRFTEDIIPVYVLLDGIRFGYLNRYEIWYEYGEGISSKKREENEKRLHSDVCQFYYDLAQRYPKCRYVRRAKLLGTIINLGGVKSQLLRILLFPDRFVYLLIHKVLIKEKNAPSDTGFIRALYEEEEEQCKS